MPKLNRSRITDKDTLIYCHLFGIIGDWYLSELSEDKKTAFGYKHICAEDAWETEKIMPNCSEWGEISIQDLQELVNNSFIKEKDIRFLIARDLSWSPTKFSDIDVKEQTLLYPGISNRR